MDKLHDFGYNFSEPQDPHMLDNNLYSPIYCGDKRVNAHEVHRLVSGAVKMPGETEGGGEIFFSSCHLP